jgi:hypothetical protein
MLIRSLAVAGVALIAFGSSTRADEPINLKVLYAGNPDSDRERDFKSLLEGHFAKVATTSYEKFQEKEAERYDVVIFDWTSIYPRDETGKIQEKFDRLNSPTPPQLSEEYDRPTILIGAAGVYVGRPLRLLLDWR